MWFTAQKERQAERQNRIKAQSQVRIFVLGSVLCFQFSGIAVIISGKTDFPIPGQTAVKRMLFLG